MLKGDGMYGDLHTEGSVLSVSRLVCAAVPPRCERSYAGRKEGSIEAGMSPWLSSFWNSRLAVFKCTVAIELKDRQVPFPLEIRAFRRSKAESKGDVSTSEFP
jgi:hypothetical protein